MRSFVLSMVLTISLAASACASAPAAPGRGRMVEVAPGRSLRIVCEGPPDAATPTVVLEAGAFGFSADWGEVQARLAATGVRSCSYDRAGLGFSDPGPAPRDAAAQAADLDALLRNAGVAGPYVLVGHSLAGLTLRLYAAQRSDSVAGVVLLDAVTPEASVTPRYWRWFSRFTDVARLADVAARVGVLRLFGGMADQIGLTGEARAEKRRFFADRGHNRAAAAEATAWSRSATEAVRAAPFRPEWPVAVVTAGARTGRFAEYAKLQAAPALASQAGSVEAVEGATHADLLGVQHADRVVAAILWVRAAAAAARPADGSAG